MDPSNFGSRRSESDVGVTRDGQARLESRPTVGQFGRSRHQRAGDPTGGFLSRIARFFGRR